MSKKRKLAKRAQRERSKRSRQPAPAFGSLADRLGAALTPDLQQGATRSAPPPPEAPPVPEPPQRVTHRELMARAYDALGSGPSGKFTGQGYEAGDVEIVDELDHGDPPDEPELSEDELLFYAAMGQDVSPLTQAKTRIQRHSFSGIRWRDAGTNTPSIDAAPTTGAERKLLRRARKNGTQPVTSVRHMTRAEALRHVHAFVREHHRAGVRFVRIIVGKGRQSQGPPVLKPAVAEWCALEGRRFVVGLAPQNDASGDYGSVVLELSRT